ncbi:helix-turn-helix domain-containing protein [Bradyrhizobium huanghuaihaiense]|uniref:helix-turn-helix domain-containing protein n=1 Tax=Bradyrhizobium huanghuaihaiense TaxID=990078 RepID=UPI0021A9C2D2|nr:helix-turn-helix domain-containing protein [Bradyrhizobium sp. CB3035]UWU77911.1 helix-turn-helix domain-containing protein [Bradyrhizobium sp. CB3035]
MIDLDTCSDYALLSTAEVAQSLRISEGAVRKAVREERLKAIAGFRVLYFAAREVRAFASGMSPSSHTATHKQRSTGDDHAAESPSEVVVD